MVKRSKAKKPKFRRSKNKTKKQVRTNKAHFKRHKKIIGGTLSDLLKLDPTQKTIVLVGEIHTSISDHIQYEQQILKQKQVIDFVASKFGRDKTFFYSEAPQEFLHKVFKEKAVHSSVIAQYAFSIMPIKLSSVKSCDRQKGGQCDEEYSDDILSIFKNERINCVVAMFGLLHVPNLKRILLEKRPDMKVVIVNTVSKEQLKPLLPALASEHEDAYMMTFLDEPPYDFDEAKFGEIGAVSKRKRSLEEDESIVDISTLPEDQTYHVDVLLDSKGQKIYKCPSCGIVSGKLAPQNPSDLSLFRHELICPNKGKYPKEN